MTPAKILPWLTLSTSTKKKLIVRRDHVVIVVALPTAAARIADDLIKCPTPDNLTRNHTRRRPRVGSDLEKIMTGAKGALWETDLAQTYSLRNRFRWWHEEDRFHGAGCTCHHVGRRD